MALGSLYLIKPLRTLREACRDTSAAHPELITGDCDSCLHGKLCAISEQIACIRQGGKPGDCSDDANSHP
jgi:hypothetical protein